METRPRCYACKCILHVLVRFISLCFSSFQCDIELSAEISQRQSRGNYGCTTLANTDMVLGATETSSGLSTDSSTGELIVTGEFQENTSAERQTASDSLSLIRQCYKSRNISGKATEIILASWRVGTQKQYVTYIKKWISFCSKRQINSIQANINDVLEFLTELFENGIGYSAMNTARCALSAIGLVKDGFAIGAHPVIIRYMKGIFNLRPSGSKYTEIWPVSKVLLYMQKLSPVKDLSLKLLTYKLAMLIALTLASRTQSIHLLSIENMSKCYDTYTLHYSGLLKQSRPGYTNPVAELKAYPIDRRLCVIFALKEYLKRTEFLRQGKTCLFISYIKPHKAVSRDTVSRWLRMVMANSGIDCSKFKTHSIRSAVTSKAKINFIPIDKIMKVAGWSNTKTFGTYYNKPVQDDRSRFSDAVLKL